MTEPLKNGASLEEAKNWLRGMLDEGGASCPLCGQLAKVYRRPIHAAMAAVLIRATREVQHGAFFHLPTFTRMGGDTAKLRFWGFLEEEPTVRPDGGRAGYWRVTDSGLAFARGHIRPQKYARVYDGRLLGFEGPGVSIQDCLGKRFDYEELMHG